MKTLVDLVQGDLEVPFAKGPLAEAINEVTEDQKKSQTKAIKNVLKTLVDVIKVGKINLKEARKKEKRLTKHMKRLEHAMLFFGETGNPLPALQVAFINEHPNRDRHHKLCVQHWNVTSEFCQYLGIDVPPADHDGWKIPNDWHPVGEKSESVESQSNKTTD